MKTLSEEQIQTMRKVRDQLIMDYGERDLMLERYDEIYFMRRGEKPKGLKVQDEDIKETISSSGRDSVTGLKRILDSGKVHIKMEGKGGDPDKVEAGLKRMLKASSTYKLASVEKDLNLSSVLHGPASLHVELVDDLIAVQTKETKQEDFGNGYAEAVEYKNEYVAQQLQLIRAETPFLLHAVSARQSYPLWGAFGMIGHCRKNKVKGAELADRFNITCDPNTEYEVKDFFYYQMRLVEAEGIAEPLLATEWVARDEKGKMIGSINIPIFTRYSGGSTLFDKPEEQSQPLLYAKAKGQWDLRENLYWTYLFTSLFNQGLPGPVLMVDPENSDAEVDVDYRKGIRIIRAKGTLADPQVIDGDVLRLKDLMDGASATQTIQPQTLGQNTSGVTFSQFALASKAGLIPAVDPKAAMEELYQDAFTHILQRIKYEDIQNDLIAPADIPEKFKLTVTLEPDLEQDDLRNAQVATQLRQAGLASRQWIEQNILKIADSDEMWKERKIEELMDSMLEMAKSPEMMTQFLQAAMGKPAKPPEGGAGELPSGGGDVMNGAGPMPGGEQLPMTDAMVPVEERT